MKTFKLTPSVALTFLALLLTFHSCQPDEVQTIDEHKNTKDYSGQLAIDWLEQSIVLTKTTNGYAPPVAARTYGYLGLALYESVVDGMPRFNSLSGQLNGYTRTVQIETGKTYYWPACANSALAYMTKQMYEQASAENLDLITQKEQSNNDQFASKTDAETLQRSIAFGKAVAEEIYEWSKSDGGHQAYLNLLPSDYQIPVGEGYWVPTPPAFKRPLLPYWGDVRSFVPNNIALSQPIHHAQYSIDPSSAFYSQGYEVYYTVNHLTPEQLKIAKYWSDDPVVTATPPGHSVSIMNQILNQKDASLEFAAHAYAKLGMAVADAFVSCWKCKYDFNLMRPITYIQQHIDPNWNSILTTPNFPEYTSGHSVQSGASMVILSNLFGNNFAFVDSTNVSRTDIDGTPRHYSSFEAAAQEAAISRLYGGIHYSDAIVLGIDQGKKIGVGVLKLDFYK